MTVNNKLFFAFVFVLLLAGRISIAGTGYLEDTDELLYLWIHMHFAGFSSLATWTKCMYDVQGQPPEIFIRLLEYISVLPISAATGKQMMHPGNLIFIGLYNILSSLLILYVFMRIVLKLQFTTELALTGVVLLGTLFNYNMYTRHILPYDNALLFQLLALNVLLRDNLSNRAIFLGGLLSATGLTNYMGCFMLVFINGGYIVMANYKTPGAALTKSILFIIPFILLILIYEVFARISGGSYLGFITHYYGTVNTGGSYDEGLIYVFLYFYLVEKWWGLILLFLFFAGSFLVFKKIEYTKVRLVLALGIVAYLSYGGFVCLFHKMVFEGRLLHIYYPFIIIGVLSFMQQQKLWKINHLIVTIVFIAFLNYVFVLIDFNSIGYPRNAIYKYGLFEQKGKVSFSYFQEMPGPMYYSDRATWYIDSTGPACLPAGNYALGNLCFLLDVPDSLYKRYQPWQRAFRDSVVYEQLHFESHPAYTLEYHTRFGRNFYLEKKFKIRVVRQASSLIGVREGSKQFID